MPPQPYLPRALVRYQSAALPCKNNCANHPIKEVHHLMKRILSNTYTLLLIEKQNVTCSYDPTFIVKNVLKVS